MPFFLLGGKARAEGYGERLAVLPDSAAEWLVVTRPSVGCSTPEMFARLDDAPYEWREFPELDTLYNDFERVAPCESIDLIERLLAFGARDAGLTGSGSAVFGRFGNEAHASEAVEQLENEPPARAWAVRTLTRGESLAVNQ